MSYAKINNIFVTSSKELKYLARKFCSYMRQHRLDHHFGIKRFYQKSIIQIVLWSWVTALRSSANWSRKDAIRSFQQYFNAEELDYQSLGQQYYYTHKNFMKDFDHECLEQLEEDQQ